MSTLVLKIFGNGTLSWVLATVSTETVITNAIRGLKSFRKTTPSASLCCMNQIKGFCKLYFLCLLEKIGLVVLMFYFYV